MTNKIPPSATSDAAGAMPSKDSANRQAEIYGQITVALKEQRYRDADRLMADLMAERRADLAREAAPTWDWKDSSTKADWSDFAQPDAGADEPCPNAARYDSGNCCGGACFAQPPARENAAEALTLVGFLKSVIRCGEPFTAEVDKAFDTIQRALTAAAAHDAELVALARALIDSRRYSNVNEPFMKEHAATIERARILGEACT